MFLVFALTDERNAPPPANLTPLFVGLLVVGYGTAWRDQYGNLYFWVPIVGPLLGGLVGGAGYPFGVTRSLPTH